MLLKSLKWLRDRYFSFKYLKLKKSGMVKDVYVPEWRAELKESDIYQTTLKFNIGNGCIVHATVIDADTFGRLAKGVYLNIDKIDGLPYITHCSVKEIHEKYLPLLNYLLERDCTLDILKIKEEIVNGTSYNRPREKDALVNTNWGFNVR